MQTAHQITSMLHNEHVVTISALQRLENMLARNPPHRLPDFADPGTRQSLADFAALFEGQLASHFAFEENILFPRLEAQGDGDIGAALAADHRVILPLGIEIARIARAGQTGDVDGEDWGKFWRSASELADRLFTHIQKEEMGLLPVLEELVEGDEDWELAAEFTMSQ